MEILSSLFFGENKLSYIEDFENNLSKILENEQFRNLLLKKQKIFLDENVANQGSASINLIKFLDNLKNNWITTVINYLKKINWVC